MKTLLLSILLWNTVTGCKKSEINSVDKAGQLGEVAAVITKIDLSALERVGEFEIFESQRVR